MSRVLGAMLFVVAAGVACGESNGDAGSGSNAGQPATAGHGNSAGSSNAGTHSDGGSANSAGSKSAGGGDKGSGGDGAGGKLGSAGSAGQNAGGAAPGGGSPGAGEGGNGGTLGEGGAPEVDPRPGCSLAAKIEPSNLRVTQGAGPGGMAKLSVDVKNASDQFVSYNPITFSCTGAAVEGAGALLTVFGISQGQSATLELELDFKGGAKSGDVAHCTVRGFIMNQTPDDCANAPTASIDVKVQ